MIDFSFFLMLFSGPPWRPQNITFLISKSSLSSSSSSPIMFYKEVNRDARYNLFGLGDGREWDRSKLWLMRFVFPLRAFCFQLSPPWLLVVVPWRRQKRKGSGARGPWVRITTTSCETLGRVPLWALAFSSFKWGWWHLPLRVVAKILESLWKASHPTDVNSLSLPRPLTFCPLPFLSDIEVEVQLG